MPVLVVLEGVEHAPAVVRWGLRLARSRASAAHVLLVRGGRGEARVSQHPFVLAEDASDADGELRTVRAAIAAALAEAPADLARPPTLRLLSGANEAAPAAVLALADELGIGLLVAGTRDRRRGTEGDSRSLARVLLTAAPMAVCLLRAPRDPGPDGRRVLVATGGGPQARVALSLAGGIARESGQPLGVLHVTPAGAPEASEVGRHHLTRALHAAHLDARVPQREIVVVGGSPREGIAKEAASGSWDLVMVGAEGDGFSTRLLFGTIGEHLLTRDPPLSVAVVRRARPLPGRIWRAIESWTHGRLPQLGREQRIALVDRLEEGSRLGVDFLLLMTLSTLIAGFGLLQNSTAVVVGAMLVAPLMTPIMGIGLSLVQGNAVLLRTGARSLVLGFLCALAVGLVLGAIVPGSELTPELVARGGPNLLDLGVAFASGLAGAYAISRPGLSAALPGVAIAAALVPPVATVGIALARGATITAHGAALLFGTNVVAIIIASALALNAVGMAGPRGERSARRWARVFAVGLAAAVALLTILLVTIDWSGRPQPVDALLHHQLRAAVEPEHRLLTARLVRDRGTVLELVLAGPQAPDASLRAQLADLARAAGVAAERIRIRHQPVHEWSLEAAAGLERD